MVLSLPVFYSRPARRKRKIAMYISRAAFYGGSAGNVVEKASDARLLIFQ